MTYNYNYLQLVSLVLLMLGYGHGDVGREKLDEIVAKLMGAESAIVRLQLFSGTHAIASALFGAMRPGDKMLCVTGHPYDTLEEVCQFIFLANGFSSLIR